MKEKWHKYRNLAWLAIPTQFPRLLFHEIVPLPSPLVPLSFTAISTGTKHSKPITPRWALCDDSYRSIPIATIQNNQWNWFKHLRSASFYCKTDKRFTSISTPLHTICLFVDTRLDATLPKSHAAFVRFGCIPTQRCLKAVSSASVGTAPLEIKVKSVEHHSEL